eukprot:5198665-Amphidinium_carterae.1
MTWSVPKQFNIYPCICACSSALSANSGVSGDMCGAAEPRTAPDAAKQTMERPAAKRPIQDEGARSAPRKPRGPAAAAARGTHQESKT